MKKEDTQIVKIRRIQLKNWIDAKFDGVQAGFIEKTGINQGELSGLLKTKSFGEKRARALEALAGMPDRWLDGLDGATTQLALPEHINTEPGPDITGRVPLISWVQAGHWAEIIDNHYPGDVEEWRLTTAKVSKNAFALRIVGDSMINPNGYPSLPPGAIVIVEPHRQPQNGDIVIARLEDSMEATIKKLVIDGHQKFLKPLNPQYPVIQINGNCTICGVAIKVEMDL